MINHFSIAVKNHKTAEQFYEAVLSSLNYNVLRTTDDLTMFKNEKYGDMFVIHTGEPYPFHFAFDAETHNEVDAFYKVALENGGTDNGAPGIRENYGPDYYGAFVIDPDGYRIEAVCNRPKKD